MTNGANRLATVLTVVGIVVPIVVTVIGAAVVLNRSIGRVEGEVGGLQDRFDDFGRQLATFDEITRRIDPQVAVLEAQVAAFTPGVTRFDRTIGTLEGSLNELRMEHGRIISELANIREIQRAMQAPLDRTVRYVAPEGSEPLPPGFYQDVTARLRRIEERLNAVAERIRGAGG